MSDRSNNAEPGLFPVVAIGGAEGAEEALVMLLKNLPTNTGMAFIYIQQGVSNTTQLIDSLNITTEMPVLAAAEEMAVAPNHLYLLSYKAPLTLFDGSFTTGENETYNTSLAINRFFISVAENYKDVAIGIILSGDEKDGAIGLKAIKMAAGITFVQDESARFQNLPRSAAAAEGAADFTLSPQRIAEELANLSAQKELYSDVILNFSDETSVETNKRLQSILHLLHRSTGVDFSQYKPNTIRRRIVRRMMLHKLTTVEEYTDFLRQNTAEISLLYNDLLINVTTFFRDNESSEYLKKELLPRLVKSKGISTPVRVWVPACSTGQEAYSLAMLLIEAFTEDNHASSIQIFATDLSESAINKARLGVYTRDEVADVPQKRLQRFFSKIDGHYRIIKSIRDLCIFATHNIAKDPPFSRLDIISCCNLLIYLDLPLQKKVMNTFHYSLVNSGYLILGKSESVGTSSYLFSQVEKRHKIFSKKKDATAKAVFEMNYRLSEEPVPENGKKITAPKKNLPEIDLEKAVDTLLLKRFTPASVLINGDLDILQFRGSTGLYLEPSPGKASLNLLKMARSGLAFELRSLVHKVKKTGDAQKKSGLELTIEGKSHLVSIEALPMKSDADQDYFLVVFETLANTAEASSLSLVRDRRIKQLEAELAALREDMRSIVEAQEAANEELQSANEEIVSSNEELQSINEELETSKEEIESSNEELITINQELQMRNEQLVESQEYGEAVFTTIRESLVILDKDLRIKSANKAFYKTFKFKEEETEGRLLYDLNNRHWNIPKLRELFDEVLLENTKVQGVEIAHFFPGVGEKVLLFNIRSVAQKTHGQRLIIMAIEDITHHREGERLIEQREAWLRNLADTAPAMIWIAGPDGLCTFVNGSYTEFRGITTEEALNKPWYQQVHPDDEAICIAAFEESYAAKKPYEVAYRLLNKDGDYRNVINKAKPNFNTENSFSGFIGSCIEVAASIEELWGEKFPVQANKEQIK